MHIHAPSQIPIGNEITLLWCRSAHPESENDAFWLQIDTVLCGECESSTSSSSSSSEDECGTAEMGNAITAQSTLGEASNVVPMPAKVKADKGTVMNLPDEHQRA